MISPTGSTRKTQTTSAADSPPVRAECLINRQRDVNGDAIDLTLAAMEALVGPNYVGINLVPVTVTKLPAGSHEGKKESQ